MGGGLPALTSLLLPPLLLLPLLLLSSPMPLPLTAAVADDASAQ